MMSSIDLYNPLVSCLCVSYQRPQLLRQAIHCFLAQSYTNKELIVVHNIRDKETIAVLNEFSNSSIHCVCLDTQQRRLTLGELRNVSLENAEGEYVCTWDDDDWYGVDRIKSQIESVRFFHKSASIISNLLMFDRRNSQAYLSHRRQWEPSLLVLKNKLVEYKIRYPAMDQHEDAVVISALMDTNEICPTLDPRLYIYQFTGGNTCSSEHFDNLFRVAQPLSPYQTHVIKKALDGSFTPQEAKAKMQTQNFMKGLDLLQMVREY